MKRRLLRCLTAVATLLLSASCTSELALEGAPQSVVDGEEVEVTFSISALSSSSSMRSDTIPKGPGQWQKYIGRGKNVDMLIYTVYEQDTITKKYTALPQYGQGLVNDDITDDAGNSLSIASSKAMNKKSAYDAQTIYNATKEFGEDGSGKVEIKLRLMRNKTYHIAFWAQSSKTDAYDTDSLEAVTVDYANAKNNDETRDAFCKVETFSVGVNSSTREVILTRPFAQINVGTTGADYSYVVNNMTNRKYTQSQITLSGIAQCLNVVTDQVVVDPNDYPLLDSVTFICDTIPAYVNMSTIPTEDSALVGGVDFTDSSKSTGGYKDTNSEEVTEEFLRVNLNDDKEILDYKVEYPTLGADTDKNDLSRYFLTETFKYLSMCYVLVPATRENSTLITVDDVSYSETGEDGKPTKLRPSIEGLTNVPVHRNWRTNILCGLFNTENTPPIEDPTSIVKKCQVAVTMDTNYQGEYNTTDEGVTWSDGTDTWNNWDNSSEEDEEPEDE